MFKFMQISILFHFQICSIKSDLHFIFSTQKQKDFHFKISLKFMWKIYCLFPPLITRLSIEINIQACTECSERKGKKLDFFSLSAHHHHCVVVEIVVYAKEQKNTGNGNLLSLTQKKNVDDDDERIERMNVIFGMPLAYLSLFSNTLFCRQHTKYLSLFEWVRTKGF